MADIIRIHQKQRFTLDAARGLLPVVRRLTERAVDSYRRARARLESGRRTPEESTRIDAELSGYVEEWMGACQKLGCEAKGLWIVDFDSGDGYYCWKFPEDDILYFHGHEDGFAGRVPIEG